MVVCLAQSLVVSLVIHMAQSWVGCWACLKVKCWAGYLVGYSVGYLDDWMAHCSVKPMALMLAVQKVHCSAW